MTSDSINDIDKLFAQEASELEKDKEISRILGAFKLNPYEILDLDPGASEKDIKATYRRKSLLIHPDKTKNPNAVQAFDILKKAETELSDTEKRENLDTIMSDARRILLREEKLDPFKDPEVLSEEFRTRVRLQAKEILINEELRRRKALKLAMKTQGEEERKLDMEMEKRKRKVEDQKVWEESRDERVSGWRQYQQKSKKKKKDDKLKVLG